jgi:hypothetical protein
MTNIPRRHHYISQCYLRGFLADNQKKDQITVIDLKQKKSFETNIINIAVDRDFNTAKIGGNKSTEIESVLSKVEDIIAKGLKQIEKDKNLSNEESNAIIFNLIALIVSRNPSSRSNHVDFQKKFFKQFSNIMVSSNEVYENLRKRSKIDETASYEQMKEFIQSDRYRIEVPNECCIPLEFEAIDVILPYLFNRGWILAISSEKTGPFVSSDHPVILTWKYPEKVPLFNRNHPGFGMQDTRVQFSISKHLALIGEIGFTNTVYIADKYFVSLINSTTMHFAASQVYAPDLNFFFKNSKGEIALGSTIFKGEVAKDNC